MLRLLLLFALVPQSIAPNCGLETRVIADGRVWTPGSDDLVLVEIANPNPFPVVLPSPDSIEQSVRFRLRTDRGEFRPRGGGTYCAMAPTAWRTVGLVLPPRSALHLAYGSDLLTEGAWCDLPVRGELLVRVEFDAGLVERAQSSRPSDAAVASGTFEAALSVRVERTPDWGGRTNPDLAFRSAAKEFLQSVSRRAWDRAKLRGYRVMVADGRLGASWRARIQELEAHDLDVAPDEVGEFLERYPSNSLFDDVWFSFARDPVWDDRPDVRERLLAALVRARPGSTGAIRAAAWKAWPRDWELYVIEPTGYRGRSVRGPGVPIDDDEPEAPETRVEDPYPWVSRHARFEW